MTRKLFTLFICTWLLISCNSEEVVQLVLSEEIKTSSFAVNTPEGWNLHEDQGIDTYIGRVAGPVDTIYFDHGYLSFGGLDYIEPGESTIYFRETLIDFVPAVLHKEYFNGGIRLSVYLDNGNQLNRMYVIDPQNEELILKIFKSHRFLV